MDVRLSDGFRDVVRYSREEAVRTGYHAVEVDHLLLGILRSRDKTVCDLLNRMSVDIESMKRYLDMELFQTSPVQYSEADSIPFGKAAQNMLRLSVFEAGMLNQFELKPLHLLLSILREGESTSAMYLMARAVTPLKVVEKLSSLHEQKPFSFLWSSMSRSKYTN